MSTFLLWVVVRVNEIVDAHSGYGLPWSPWSYTRPSERHEYHHSHNIGCYGSFFPFWDWAMGTDVDFRAFLSKGAWRNRDTTTPAKPAQVASMPAKDGTVPKAAGKTATTPLRRNPPRAAKSAAKRH